jgi:hypothetical protein
VTKQIEAANHIQELLNKAGYSVTPRKITLENNQHWIILEYKEKQIGIDSVSGVWVRESIRDDWNDWKCLAMPCSVSGALQAVEFLIQSSYSLLFLFGFVNLFCMKLYSLFQTFL